MIEEKKDYLTSPESLQSLEYIQLLINTASRQDILEKIRHSRTLARKILQGFDTPQGQLRNWNIIEKKLVRQAQEEIGVVALLLDTWLRSNYSFFERIKGEIHEGSVEDDVAKLLASLENLDKDKNRLFCALILDARESVQQALRDGLQEDLMNMQSLIFINAERYKLRSELEKKKKQHLAFQTEIDRLKKSHEELLIAKVTIQNLEQLKEQLEAQHKEEIKRRDKLLQEVKDERDTLEKNLNATTQETNKLQTAFESEQAHRVELQRQMDELKNSLDTVIAYQQENASTIKRQLNETVQQLENERKEYGRLRQNETNLQLSVKRTEREKDEAYKKRDEERSRREHLEVSMERAEHAKESLIEQARQSKTDLEQLRAKLYDAQRVIEHKERALQESVSFNQLDYQSWAKAIDNISQHVTLSLSKYRLIDEAISITEKWADWQSWQQIEAHLVEPLLASSNLANISGLADIESAQKLLTLRWYLLEWLKLIITEAIRANSRVLPQT